MNTLPTGNQVSLLGHFDVPVILELARFWGVGYQSSRRHLCQEDRRQFVQVCRDYLLKSFDVRIRAVQDRVMAPRQRENLGSPEVALARQRAENDLSDLKRIRRERMARLDRLDYEQARGWECERVGHLKIGFDFRSHGPAHPQTGYRGPVKGIRRIEVKGRKKGATIRLTVNEWYRAVQLCDRYWLYVVLNPLNNPDPTPICIQNPVKRLDHAKKEIVAARCFDVPADAIEAAARTNRLL